MVSALLQLRGDVKETYKVFFVAQVVTGLRNHRSLCGYPRSLLRTLKALPQSVGQAEPPRGLGPGSPLQGPMAGAPQPHRPGCLLLPWIS